MRRSAMVNSNLVFRAASVDEAVLIAATLLGQRSLPTLSAGSEGFRNQLAIGNQASRAASTASHASSVTVQINYSAAGHRRLALAHALHSWQALDVNPAYRF